jgi:ParB/RepB/Spo0J family partition protein
MAKSVQKITLSQSRDIPFNRLVLSQSNVRRIKAGVSIEELAEDIARRTLLQSLTVRAVLDGGGAETGMFEVPAGGRRYRALELLVKQKRLARTAPIPCVVRTEGIAEEDSLAENVQRAPLHPLDQFRAFLALREKGMGEEEIAGGRGIGTRENYALVEQLAAVFGGVPACSRPLVDMGWFDASRQVGLSGRTVKPRLYIACGISGAMEHLHGMKESGLIVAINQDSEAPIFKVAHYGLLGDLNEIIPALAAGLAARK